MVEKEDVILMSIKFYFNRFFKKINSLNMMHQFKKMEHHLQKTSEPLYGQKVLFTQSFCVYPPCFVHDKLLAIALRLRGFEVTAAFCDGVQKNRECGVFGGVWQRQRNFDENCAYCQERSKKLWAFLPQDKIFRYSAYLSAGDYDWSERILLSLQLGEWVSFVLPGGLELGKWAKDYLVNNYVVADYTLIPEHEALGRCHLKNLLLAYRASERIMNRVKPNRIISNDSFYGIWKIWEVLAAARGIPFYSHWSGTRRGGWCYAYGAPAMNLDFSVAWPNFSKETLTDVEALRVERWLTDRAGGEDMILDTASLSSFKNEKFELSQVDPKKPTALMLTNTIWDLAALNKEVFTAGMMEWVVDTIDWFAAHPDYQLILKPHPLELHPTIPATRESIAFALKKNRVVIPSNVFVLSPKVALTAYNLMPFCKVGLVFTSTVGMEMAARGFPVITAGRAHYRGYGFTLDPANKMEYFHTLKGVLSRDSEMDTSFAASLARKYIKFNFFHYYTKTGLFEFRHDRDGDIVIDLYVKNIEHLRKGHYEHFDYIVERIERGEPILSKDNWPKES